MKYEEFVKKTALVALHDVGNLDYFIHGLVEEVGELTRLRRKALKGVNISHGEWESELGDILWYLTAILQCQTTRLSINDLKGHNMAKLDKKQKELYGSYIR